MATETFHWADYVVFAIFLVVSAGIGIFVGYINRKKRVDAKGFLTGGGDMHWMPVSLSMTASFMSAIFVISIPGEVYTYGSTYCFLAISYFLGFTFAGHVHLPILHRLGITSGYQYLEMRFNRTVRLSGSMTFSMMMFLYNGVVLYTPAVALSQVSGIQTWVSIILTGGIVTFYTALGGLKATVWNDALQATIILLNFLLIIIFGSIDVGGLGHALDIAKEDGLDKLYDPATYDPNPLIRTTFWTQVIGGAFTDMVLYSASQTVIQKFLSVKSIRNAQIAVWISAAATAFYMCLVFFIGCLIYSKYRYCDPILNNDVEKIDQIMSKFVMDVMGHLHGLPGLFLAAAFSATLSTVSGGLNAMAAVYLEDFIAPAFEKLKGKPLDATVAKVVTRGMAITFGVLTILVAFLSEVMGSVAVQIALSIFGMVGAPLCGILTLGMFFPFANAWGALAGLFSSLGLTLWIGIGSIVEQIPTEQMPKNVSGCDNPIYYSTASLYTEHTTMQLTTEPTYPEDDYLQIYLLSYNYYSLFAIGIALVVGVIVSLVTGGNKDPEKLDPRLYFFCQDEVCFCCCYGKCRCGVPEKTETIEGESTEKTEMKEPVPNGVSIGYIETDDAAKNDISDSKANLAYENEAYIAVSDAVSCHSANSDTCTRL